MQFLENTRFLVDEGDYAVVNAYWPAFVAYYPYNRLYYIKEGGATLFCKDREVHLAAGRLYFVPSYSVVTSECRDILGHYFIHFRTQSPISNLFDLIDFTHTVEADARDEALFQLVCANLPADTPQKLVLLEGAFRILFSRFLGDARLKNANISRFLDVLAYIEDNIAEPISLADLAGFANLNPNYFSSLFSKTFGVSPLEYVLNQRINKSMVMLLNRSWSVREIAYKLGFQDEFYFSRLFKKRMGISPRAFRQSAGSDLRAAQI